MTSAALLAAAGLAGFVASPAMAAACTKTQGTDFTDRATLQTVLTAGCSGGGTLTVDFTSGFTLDGTALSWSKTDALILQGQGAGTSVLDGNDASRILNSTSASSALTIVGLTIQKGLANSASVNGASGGGIRAVGSVTVSNSVIANNNVSSSNGTNAFGGGILATGALTMTNSTISGNTSSSNSSAYAGGLYGGAAVTVTTSTISNNDATSTGSATTASGGGIYAPSASGTKTLTNSTVSTNSVTSRANARGGGVLLQGVSNLIGSTLSGNTVTADSDGDLVGDGYGGGVQSSSTSTTNTTISDNQVTGAVAAGGGISDGGDGLLLFSTIVGNTAADGANIDSGGPGTTVSSIGSVIATNGVTNSCSSMGSTAGTNNLSLAGDTSCGFAGSTNVSALWADMNIGALANNGGSTQTRMPGSGSALINRVPSAVGAANGVSTDQRGVSRTGSQWWIGAAQANPAVVFPAVFSLTPNGGSTAGGTSVVISGTDLTGATAVTFGGTPATTYNVDSATQITATAPAHTAGTVHVQVTTPGGASANTSADDYLYATPPTPAITGLNPSGGSTTGGTSVVISGTDLTGATAVTFGGTPATTYNVDSATQITATAPAHTAGTVHVQVTTPGGASANTSADDYLYATPNPGPDTTQNPLHGCVTPGSTTSVPRHGTKQLMAAGCVTNAPPTSGGSSVSRASGQVVGATVSARQRGDLRYYSLFCKVSKSKTTKTSSTGYGNGSRYCKKGALMIRTYGAKLVIRVTWNAPRVGSYAAYQQTKTYKT